MLWPRLPVCFRVHTRSPATSWRPSAVAQAVQIPKQTPEGSRRVLLDSPEPTDSSQMASWIPLLSLAGPGDVELQPRLFWIPQQRPEGSCQRPQDWNLSSVLKLCPPSLLPGPHQVSCTSWRLSAVAQAVQTPKQTPEGSCCCRDLLDSPEHTDSSQPASQMPLLPLARPGDVSLQPRLSGY